MIKWIRTRDFFIDNLLARTHFIIVMIRWTGLRVRGRQVEVRAHLQKRTQRPVHLIITMIKRVRTVNKGLVPEVRGRDVEVRAHLKKRIQGQILSQSPTDAIRFWCQLTKETIDALVPEVRCREVEVRAHLQTGS